MEAEPAIAALRGLMEHIADPDADAPRSITIRCKGGRFSFEVDEHAEPDDAI